MPVGAVSGERPDAARRRAEARAWAAERLRHERNPSVREGLALVVELADEADVIEAEGDPRCAHCGLPPSPGRPLGVLALRCGEVVAWRSDPAVAGVVERDVCSACGEATQAASEAECAWLAERRSQLSRAHAM